MLVIHRSPVSRDCVSGVAVLRQRERRSVGTLAESVAVAIDVAEAVEQRACRGRIVRCVLRHRGDRSRRRPGGSSCVAGMPSPPCTTRTNSGDVEPEPDRAAQRDPLLRVAADDRIVEVEIRVEQRRHRVADVPDAARRVLGLELAVLQQALRRAAAEQRVVEIALLEREELRAAPPR